MRRFCRIIFHAVAAGALLLVLLAAALKVVGWDRSPFDPPIRAVLGVDVYPEWNRCTFSNTGWNLNLYISNVAVNIKPLMTWRLSGSCGPILDFERYRSPLLVDGWWIIRLQLDHFIVHLLLVPALWVGIHSSLWINRTRARRRMDAGHCVRCGYDLRASNEKCPECGEPIAAVKPPSSSDRDETKPASDA